jgi:uncharacterized membrane protein
MIRLIWNRLQTSIWFIPSVLALAGLVLAVLLVNLDLRTDFSAWAWLDTFKIGTAGVRQVLSVTTGAMMTITGVVFSISVVTLTLAANQFGAKILRNYLSDSHNKVVLGLFVGSFLYGLVVLASIDSDRSGHVPTLAFMTSLVLTLIAVAALIYFIHNISTSIQADRLIAVIGANLGKTVTATLSAPDEDADTTLLREKWALATRGNAGVPVCADHSGYAEYIDYDALLDTARRCQCTVEIHIRPGAFVIHGNPVATIRYLGADRAVTAADVNRHISLGAQRTDVQDLEFAIMQLLQIAQRALSPGINDSLTAISCIDWLSAALACMAERRFRAEYLTDADGCVRLRIHAFDFAGAADAIFNPLRQNARGNEMVTIRLLEAIGAVMQVSCERSYLEALRRHADLIMRTAQACFPDADDIMETDRRHSDCVAAFERRLQEL